MRATSPRDQIQFFGETVQLPAPKQAIGTRLDPSRLSAEDFSYYARKVLRQVLRNIRIPIKSLKAQGYLKDMKRNKMMDFHKEKVREMLDVMHSADSVEVAGHAPYGVHVSGGIGNQCYLQSGQSHSGVSYSCFLLFRKVVDGNKCAYLHKEALINEVYLKDLVLPLASSSVSTDV